MSDFLIARQPIFDRQLGLYGYELLFRDYREDPAAETFPQSVDHMAATAQVIIAGSEFGVSGLVGQGLAFINIPERFIVEPDLLGLAPDQSVLEILETVEPGEHVIKGLKALKDQGYRLALDDFVYHSRFEPLLDLVDLVKLDIQQIDRTNWATEIQRLRGRGIEVLAEKVESEEEYTALHALGCDYFQGFFFARPNLVASKRISGDRLALLSLLSEINDADTTPERIGELVSRDVSLSLRVLNAVNSAAHGLIEPIDSVRDAAVYLGRDLIQRWVSLYLLFNVEDQSEELIRVALIRARFCETLVMEFCAEQSGSAFTTGLLSVIDAMMNQPMDVLLEHMVVSQTMRAALVHHEGTRGDALRLAMELERGRRAESSEFEVDSGMLATLYNSAMRWADDTMTQATAIA